MKYGVYAIYDAGLKIYDDVRCFQNDVIANRYYENFFLARQDSFAARHKELYAVYQIAEFDDGNGSVVSLVPRKAFDISEVLPLDNATQQVQEQVQEQVEEQLSKEEAAELLERKKEIELLDEYFRKRNGYK